MRIKLDENIPASLADALARLGHDADTVPGEGLGGRSDPEVWAAAQKDRRFFVTQDLDFSDARRYEPGTHHGLLLVRLRVPGRKALSDHIRALFEAEDVARWASCFVVASDHKIRIRPPGK